MNKLTLQTVYVPVPIAGFDMTGKVSVPMLSLAGMVNQTFVSEACMMNTWRVLDKQDNRIVLTQQELGQILLDALIVASEGMPMSIDGKNQLVNQFLKSKGI